MTSKSKNIVQSDIDALARLQKLGVESVNQITFGGKKLKNITFKGFKFDGAGYVFDDAELDNVKFDNCEFSGYNEGVFSGARLNKVVFTKSTIENSGHDTISEFFAAFVKDYANSVNNHNPSFDPKYDALIDANGKTLKKLTAYKKVFDIGEDGEDGEDYIEVIATLEIPKGTAVVLNPEGCGKCRAATAKVVKFEFLYPEDWKSRKMEKVVSSHDSSFEYKIGTTVKPANGFDSDTGYCCGSGIHFYLDREDAEGY